MISIPFIILFLFFFLLSTIQSTFAQEDNVFIYWELKPKTTELILFTLKFNFKNFATKNLFIKIIINNKEG